MEQTGMIIRMLNTPKGELSIAQRPFDGYIDVTPMCHAMGKEPIGWIRNQFAKDYIEALSIELQICSSNLIQVVKGRGDSLQQGTWVHPLVASRIAQWCHPSFAVQVDRWVLEILSGRSVGPQRPPITQALIDALDAHDAHFLETDQRLDAHDTRFDACEMDQGLLAEANRLLDDRVGKLEQSQSRRQWHAEREFPKWVIQWAWNAMDGRCMKCRCKLVPESASKAPNHPRYDHIRPKNCGGWGTVDNCQLLCNVCNGSKGGCKAKYHNHSDYRPPEVKYEAEQLARDKERQAQLEQEEKEKQMRFLFEDLNNDDPNRPQG